MPYTICGNTVECHTHINLCLTVSRSAAKIQNTYNILEILTVLMHATGSMVVV